MAKKVFSRSEQDNIDALDGLDLVTPIAEQFGEVPEVVTPPEAVIPPEKTIVPEATIPPVGSPVEVVTPPTTQEVIPPTNNHDSFLKEIFGDDGFKTMEEAKTANIPKTLQEVESLRQANADLETKLSAKPKTNFASDEMAKFNEFTKVTGTANYGLFKAIDQVDIATMEPMEALVTQYVLKNPSSAGKEDLIRKHFEKKYNVDPELVEADELAINQIGLTEDGTAAKKSLTEIKEKLIVPEPVAEEKPKELSPEGKEILRKGWTNVGTEASKRMAKLKIPIKGSDEPLLDYEISEVEQKEVIDFVKNYGIKNNVELTDGNIQSIAKVAYSNLMMNKLPEIAHSIFEKARKMTEDEVYAQFENPSMKKNTDTPPPPTETSISDRDKMLDDVFEKQLKQMGG